MSIYCWKNDVGRFVQYRVATHLQLVKNVVICEVHKAMCNKMRYACIATDYKSMVKGFDQQFSEKNSRAILVVVGEGRMLQITVSGEMLLK